MGVVDEILHLTAVGLILPIRIETSQLSVVADYNVLMAHGLGPTNPKKKSHLGDKWVDLIGKGSMLTEKNVTNFSYTARGHGDSHGWEDTAEINPFQFTWNMLSSDMFAIADHYDLPNVVTSGSSMGAGSAAKCKESGSSGEKYHFVLEGAALADLPDVESESEVYMGVRCPVLILTIEGDASHPVSTAKVLHNVLPHSELHIAADEISAAREWPKVIAAFLLSLPAMPTIREIRDLHSNNNLLSA